MATFNQGRGGRVEARFPQVTGKTQADPKKGTPVSPQAKSRPPKPPAK